MLQSLRLQAFEQLVAQLARQVQATPGAPAPQWPAQGVSQVLSQVLQTLLDQIGTQPQRPLQLLAAQPGSAALMQALAVAAKGAAASGAVASGAAASGAAAPGAAAPASGGSTQGASSPGVPRPANAPANPSANAPASAQAGVPASVPGAASGAAPAASAAGLPPAAPAASAAAPATAAALAAAVTRASVADALLATAASGAAASGAAQQAAFSGAAPASPALPPLQNWWVQQGTLVTPQGERGFVLSLQVPQAWAQAQGAAVALAAGGGPAAGGPAAGTPVAGTPAAGVPVALAAAGSLAAAGPASAGLRLSLDVPLQSLGSGPVAVVLQPSGEPQSRTSALLLLELQPMRQAGVQAQPATPFAALSPVMAQEVQQLLQNRGDPWLQMAVAQASGALPRERGAMGEHRSHLCTTKGCQYEGRAPCAQPFCSEMNRIWSVSRMERAR